MADAAVRLRWQGEGLIFTGGPEGGPTGIFDGDGRAGPSPVLTLILALASCSGADVIDIAGKMRVAVGALEIDVEGDRAPEPPRRYTALRVTYRVAGVDPGDHDNIRRAVRLSEEKYCSVFHTLRSDVSYTSDIEFT